MGHPRRRFTGAFNQSACREPTRPFSINKVTEPMITSAYFVSAFGAAVPAIVRFTATNLRKFGKALLAAMQASREREAARVIARHRDLIDPNTVIIFESARAPEAAARDAAERRDHLLAFGQAIPFQSTSRIVVPQINGHVMGRTWRGAQ